MHEALGRVYGHSAARSWWLFGVLGRGVAGACQKQPWLVVGTSSRVDFIHASMRE